MTTVGDVKKALDSLDVTKLSSDHPINWVSSLEAPKANTICFATRWNETLVDAISNNPATLFLVPIGASKVVFESGNCLSVDNPRLAYAIIAKRFFEETRKTGTSPTARVEAGAVIGHDVYLGNNVVIESGARIGSGTSIDHNTVIHSGVVLGQDVIVGANSVIGSIGFGLERDSNGVPFRIPHLGGVTVGDEVEIGSCCTVARGTINDTVLEDQVKLDDHVFVGHNVQVRRAAYLTAGTVTCGSADIGKRAWIAPGSVVINKARVGDDVMLGLASVVVNDLPAEPEQVQRSHRKSKTHSGSNSTDYPLRSGLPIPPAD